MWGQAEETWDQAGTVKYGIYQIDATPDCPSWRRHSARFGSVRAALFNKQGARKACLGQAPYPRERYGVGGTLYVPYAAAWLQGFRWAYLIRASANDPEITLIHASEAEEIAAASDQEMLQNLAGLFSCGAEQHGVGWLRCNFIELP